MTTTTKNAFEAAASEGLRFFWATTHIGGSTQFVARSWEDGGFSVNDDGTPRRDYNGNTVANYTDEPLDPSNSRHVAQCEEWYNG